MSTVLEELVQIVPTLGVEEQRRVLEVATALRDARSLPDIMVPAAGADDEAWRAWRERLDARSVSVLDREKERLVALGLIDEHWNVLTDELPPDMLPTSETSVAT
jgi:hypothetical protein